MIIIISGPPLLGKTYIAKTLSNIFNFNHVDIDDLRNILFKDLNKIDDINLNFENTIQKECYEIINRIIKFSIDNNINYIISATYSKRHYQESLYYKFKTQISNKDIIIIEFIAKFNNINFLAKYLHERNNNQEYFGNIKTIERLKSNIEKYQMFDYSTYKYVINENNFLSNCKLSDIVEIVNKNIKL